MVKRRIMIIKRFITIIVIIVMMIRAIVRTMMNAPMESFFAVISVSTQVSMIIQYYSKYLKTMMHIIILLEAVYPQPSYLHMSFFKTSAQQHNKHLPIKRSMISSAVGSAYCECPKGFEIGSDDQTCRDIDEVSSFDNCYHS